MFNALAQQGWDSITTFSCLFALSVLATSAPVLSAFLPTPLLLL